MSASRAFLLLSLVAVLLVPTPALSTTGAPVTVWVPFDSETELALLARHLDVWEVHRDGDGGGRLLAWVHPAELAWLDERDVAYALTTPAALGLMAIPDYACYRTVDELYDQLAAWAAAYPGLTELRAIGQSYEGRPLQVLRITNEGDGIARQDRSIDRPVFFLMAGIHGRELIAPEAAMVFIERLLTGYGVDPDITWLLDTQIIEVLVTANPDGHVRNETGEPWPYWRKNANPENGFCGGTSFGIDLNRNSGFAWGNASKEPCEPVYQGPSAVSEVETQALETFVRSLFPDQRPDDLISPAPETTSGLLITLHSYGDLVLWPWGHTYADAPNAAALAQLGQKLAQYNGYVAQQASDLYPASGTTDDFAYGELGIAAYTFEIGDVFDGFYPPCSRYNALIEPNLDAFLYAAKAARAPYLLPSGPDVLDLQTSLVPAQAPSGPTNRLMPPVGPYVQIRAELTDGLSGADAIVTAEAVIGTPVWEPGTGTPLAASDGAFDTDEEVVSGTLSLAGLDPGRHLLLVRGQDAAGNWGPPTADFVTVTYGLTLSPTVQSGVGRSGTSVLYALTVANSGALSQTVTLTHTVGQWSTTLVPTSVIQLPGVSTPVTVTVEIPGATGVRSRVPARSAQVVSDVITVTATSIQAPWLRRDVRLETVALWPRAFLPLVLRP